MQPAAEFGKSQTSFPLSRALVIWLALTLVFEIGLGRATGMSWDRIASDFDPRRGGLLGFGMLVILAAPRIITARRGLVLDSDATAAHRAGPGRARA